MYKTSDARIVEDQSSVQCKIQVAWETCSNIAVMLDFSPVEIDPQYESLTDHL